MAASPREQDLRDALEVTRVTTSTAGTAHLLARVLQGVHLIGPKQGAVRILQTNWIRGASFVDCPGCEIPAAHVTPWGGIVCWLRGQGQGGKASECRRRRGVDATVARRRRLGGNTVAFCTETSLALEQHFQKVAARFLRANLCAELGSEFFNCNP